MSAFNDMLKADAQKVFLNPDEYAEDAIYKPFNGQPIPVVAIRLRQPPSKPGNTPRAMVEQEEIYLDRGVITSRPAINGDTIKFGDGDPKTVRAIKNEHDPAVWHLVIN